MQQENTIRKVKADTMVPCPEGPHPPQLYSKFLPRVTSTGQTFLDQVKSLLSQCILGCSFQRPLSAPGCSSPSPGSLWKLPLAGGTSQVQGLVKVGGMPGQSLLAQLWEIHSPPSPSAPGRPLEACSATAGSVTSLCSPGSLSLVSPLHTPL